MPNDTNNQSPRVSTGLPEIGIQTRSSLSVKSTYMEQDLEDAAFHPARDLAAPGSFPFTRGLVADGYRERLWVMGQYSGYGSPRETNRRIRNLLQQGQAGFSVALDLPTQMGLDSDDPLAAGEVGKVGVPIDSLLDMVELLDGIPLDQVRQIRTTANAVGPVFVALFLAAGEEFGYSSDQFRVMFQNDVLKEYVARGTYIFPPAAGLQFSVDAIEYCANNVPNWEPIEFCGYHIRDSGSNAVQEVAFAIANALAYLDATRARGVNIDELASSLYMFLSAGQDLFEEVAKFRATRRIWARLLHDRYDVKEEHCGLHIFAYTLGSAQTLREPLNNVVRIAYQALGAVLGGVQTLATTAYDEAFQLPSEDAVRISLRTQQILAYETGVARTTDPLAGAYFIESLTTELEDAIGAKLREVEEHDGAVGALASGWLAREIDEEAFRQHQEVESGDRPVVGLTHFTTDEVVEVGHRLSPAPGLEEDQCAKLAKLRAERHPKVVETLAELRRAAAEGRNTVPFILTAVKEYASVGEIVATLKTVWGVHKHA